MYTPTPFLLRHQDMYSISSDGFMSKEAQDLSYYSVTNRRSPKEAFPDVAQDSRIVFFGLSDFINRHLTHRITVDEVYETQLFCKQANSLGGEIYFPLEKWLYVANECKGFIPVTIEAFPEGSTMFPNVPHIEIHNTVKGFGDWCASFEAGLVGMTSLATATATFCRHFLDRLREWVAKDLKVDDPEILDRTAQWLIQNFSMRAYASTEASEVCGLAHLLSFMGTDNSNAAYQYFKRGGIKGGGSSILAQAHRNAMSYKNLGDSYEAINKAARHGQVNITSNIMDCYSFLDGVCNHLLKMANKYPNSIFVGREDSGDPIKNVLTILKLGTDHNNVRALSGNSLSPSKIFDIMDALIQNNLPATQRIVFGMGGYLQRTPTRDSLSTALKIISVGSGTENRGVIKVSEDEGKSSIPGPNGISKHEGSMKVYSKNEINPSWNLRKVYYSSNEDGPQYLWPTMERFSALQYRCIKEFDSYKQFALANPEYGLHGETLSPKIKQIQEELKAQYVVGK